MKRQICSILLLLILLLTACGNGGSERPTEGQSTVTISAVGDIFPSTDMVKDAHQISGSYDFSAQLSPCLAALSTADITIGNLEGNFTAGGYGEGSYPDALAEALAATGFDILQTANSYSIQGGLSGLSRTRSVIESVGIAPLGTYLDDKDRKENQVLLIEKNDIRIAFVAFTKGFGGMALPENAASGVNLLYTDYTTNYEKIDTEGITAVIDVAKKKSPDLIIAAVHWGSENTSEISRSQENIATLMFENGVDVILGSHSHKVGTVEKRHLKLDDGTRKDVVIAYSLGDFCSAEAGECNLSLILNLEITRDHASGVTTISDVSYTPIAAADLGAEKADRYQVLQVDNALELYENNYFDRVSGELYQKLLSGKEKLAEKVGLE